jgi:sugar phosphate permease
MFAPGIVGLAMGLFILVAVRDSPQAIGYPPVERAKEAAPAAGADPAAPPAPKESLIDLLVNDVLK